MRLFNALDLHVPPRSQLLGEVLGKVLLLTVQSSSSEELQIFDLLPLSQNAPLATPTGA